MIDLSKLPLRDKRLYVGTLLQALRSIRRSTGFPHKILLDEAHYFLSGADAEGLIDSELAGYVLVTYRASSLPSAVCSVSDVVVLVTRETDADEIQALESMCRPGVAVSSSLFRELRTSEAALLPGAEEAHGDIVRFHLIPRLTAHVRHQAKYLDVPVLDAHAFVFTENGRPGARARTLKEFSGLLTVLPVERITGHLRRHDFSQWLADVFRDHPLAGHVRTIESRVDLDGPRDVADAIGQVIRARYDTC